jgi:hypothetical protein
MTFFGQMFDALAIDGDEGEFPCDEEAVDGDQERDGQETECDLYGACSLCGGSISIYDARGSGGRGVISGSIMR